MGLASAAALGLASALGLGLGVLRLLLPLGVHRCQHIRHLLLLQKKEGAF